MLTIRDTQLSILRADRRSEFERNLTSELARHYPDLGDPVNGPALVRAAVRRAKQHGIVGASDIARFANIAAALGPEFDADGKYPWAALILAENSMTASQKVGRLCYWAQRTLSRRERGAL